MSNSQDAMIMARLVREGRRYWAGPAGQGVWQAQRACLGPLCERWFGVHGLELGLAPTLTDMCPVRHALRWSPTRELAQTDNTLVCTPDALPLPDGCLSLVVVHHLLEVVPDPHHLLQEAARVTADDGHLILFCWHPLGPGGWLRWWPGQRRRLPGRGRWRMPARLADWLAFVDFEAQRVDYCGFRLPGGLVHNTMLETLGRRHNLPFGDSFMIHARRRSQLAQPRRGRVVFPTPIAGSTLGNATGRAASGEGDRG
ncbi:methyltransferase domain-containing protein [Halomonas organivorans]|uniref:SAM-dependent methyltransferase n=1 Tax=Halomonas organivorans TaxID=257772 RepID=A0A7W5BX93_9GAMM|nr:methyltransferase domain-containing protein [Halomonas organivorans]MBB3140862.1 SAM-dependent methyltransferase [Halomonas organivorans]